MIVNVILYRLFECYASSWDCTVKAVGYNVLIQLMWISHDIQIKHKWWSYIYKTISVKIEFKQISIKNAI